MPEITLLEQAQTATKIAQLESLAGQESLRAAQESLRAAKLENQLLQLQLEYEV